ncbi:MAG TPA: C39 family peptidase [Anaerolineae bacterium]
MIRIRFIAAWMVFCFAAIVFAGAVWATVVPHEFDRRVEWVQLKIQAVLPQPPRPEFVPTPLAVQEPIDTPTLPANLPQPTAASTRTATPRVAPTRPPIAASAPLPPRVALSDFRHDYQRFNNCGPTTLSILLSHLGRSETQYDLAPLLKGNNDDRNVSPDEIVALVRSYGFRAVVRENGSMPEMKSFLAQGIPVMVESWFIPHPKDASGHYRVLTGYDDAGTASTRGVGLTVEYIDGYPPVENGFFIAQDSYIGPNIKLAYQAWDFDWRVFNRTYLVIYTDAQASVVRNILGDDADDTTMFTHAYAQAQREVTANNADAFAWFNLGTALTGLGRFDEAGRAFDRARVLKLPWRMLWYQFGPYEAYYHAGRYAEVIALANATLAASPGLEESLYYRGLAQLALGQKDAARDSFQLALKANPHFARAKQALSDAAK